MVFSSSIFLFAFLPATIALYFVLPGLVAKNVLLLVASLVFYAWGEPVYVLLMVLSIVVNWGFALLESRALRRGRRSGRGGGHAGPESLDESDGVDSLDVTAAERAEVEGAALEPGRPAAARGWLACALAFDLGMLCVFKYLPFLCAEANRLLGAEVLPALDIALPIGISFYTLQAVSYVVDVWRGRVEAQANPLYLGMYIAMFPQLVAGPIVRYSRIEEAVSARSTTVDGFAQGARLFAVGLGKKVLLANTCGVLADALLAREAAEIGFLGCSSAVVAYTFQIYFDFGGYSDMAIGLGRLFGFEYPRNFNYPYISESVTSFWRRWHMTLGSFFRDYVYIPLGGNRVSRGRWMLNILIVWSLTGIWHGAAWNFLLWGLFYGLVLVLEKLFLLRWLERWPRALRHVYVIAVFLFGWLLFSVAGLGKVGCWILALLGRYGWTGTSTAWGLQSWSYLALVPVLVVACTPVVPWLRKRIEAWCEGRRGRVVAAPERGNDFVPPCRLTVERPATVGRAHLASVVSVAADLALLAILLLSVASVVSSSYNPFIYFQF